MSQIAVTTISSKYSQDRKSTRLNSSHLGMSYAVFCLKKKSHWAAAAISQKANGIALGVSHSVAAVRIFQDRCLVVRIEPLVGPRGARHFEIEAIVVDG